jgi:high-affinity iron transporter
MLNSFIIILREGFESFLIVAVILAYLRKTGRAWLSPAVYVAIAISLLTSFILGHMLNQGVNQALWEGVLGLVAVVMVCSLVIHMWRTAPRLTKNMHKRLDEVASNSSRVMAFLGVFVFTLLMITREGMETALLLIQVHDPNMIGGAVLGLGGAALLAWAWARFGYLINLKRFFQVTAIFLLLFMLQVAVYSFHEFAEAGVLSSSEATNEAIHAATESFSPDGIYGRWFSLLLVAVCAFWLLGAWVVDRFKQNHVNNIAPTQAS